MLKKVGFKSLSLFDSARIDSCKQKKCQKLRRTVQRLHQKGSKKLRRHVLSIHPFALFANQHYSRVFRFWRTTTAKCGMPVSNKREGVFMPVLTS
jgi:hypothetical protein